MNVYAFIYCQQAYQCDKHVLVILTDMSSYADALREVCVCVCVYVCVCLCVCLCVCVCVCVVLRRRPPHTHNNMPDARARTHTHTHTHTHTGFRSARGGARPPWLPRLHVHRFGHHLRARGPCRGPCRLHHPGTHCFFYSPTCDLSSDI